MALSKKEENYVKLILMTSLLLLLFTNVPLVTQWSLGILKHFCKVHAVLDC